jgi:hypothetical protein
MWKQVKCATERDGTWFCDKCETMFHWKTLGWKKDNINRFYCDRCKKRIEEDEE